MDSAGSSSDSGDVTPAHLLIIEDDPTQGMLISRVAAMAGFEPVVARSYEDAAKLLRAGSFDGVTLDLSLRGEHGGTEVLRLLGELRCTAPIIILSGATGLQLQLTSSIAKSHKLNVCDPMPKPVDVTALKKLLAKVKEGVAAKRKARAAG